LFKSFNRKRFNKKPIILKNSTNKVGYLYLLTPKGIEAKGVLTKAFLQRKLTEYENLEQEIEAFTPPI